MCSDSLEIVRAVVGSVNRWDKFSFDTYDVCLVLSREVTSWEADVFAERFADGVTVEGSVLTVHDTTVEQVRDNRVNYARVVAGVAGEARAREAEARERKLRQLAACEAEVRRRERLAAGITFEF